MDSQTAEQIEAAYAKAQAALADLHDAAELIRLANVPGWIEPYEFNPFRHLAEEVSRLLATERKDLIERIGEDLNREHTPNVKRTADRDKEGFFTNLMDEKEGPKEFVIKHLTNFFEQQLTDTATLNAQALRQLQENVKHLIPWESTGPGYERGPAVKLEGSRLELHAYTWHTSYGPGNVETYQSYEAFRALEALIAVAGGSEEPRTAKGNAGILTHAHQNTRTPEIFYMKQEPKHPTVRAFRFFKNGKFFIDFKTPQAAHDLGALLLPQKVAQEAATAPPGKKPIEGMVYREGF